MSGLLPFSAALDQLLAGVEPLPAETLPLDDCAGRVLAKPLMVPSGLILEGLRSRSSA